MRKKQGPILWFLFLSVLPGLVFRPVIVSAQTKGFIKSALTLKTPMTAVLKGKSSQSGFGHVDREFPETTVFVPKYERAAILAVPDPVVVVPSVFLPSHPNSPLILRI